MKNIVPKTPNPVGGVFTNDQTKFPENEIRGKDAF